jgi:hypothetical protein
VQVESEASEVDYPAVRFFDRSVRLWLYGQKPGPTLEAVRNPELLLARCPYSGRTLPTEFTLTYNMLVLLELGADPTARDWQVRLELGEGAP